jgi:hypothetical protein
MSRSCGSRYKISFCKCESMVTFFVHSMSPRHKSKELSPPSHVYISNAFYFCYKKYYNVSIGSFDVGIPQQSSVYYSRCGFHVTEDWRNKEYVYVLKHIVYVFMNVLFFLARIVLGCGLSLFLFVVMCYWYWSSHVLYLEPWVCSASTTIPLSSSYQSFSYLSPLFLTTRERQSTLSVYNWDLDFKPTALDVARSTEAIRQILMTEIF